MAGSKSILVIDDEPVLQDVLGSLLEGNGFDYHQAMTAADGMRVLRDEEIDVVLLDLMLPDRSGLELLPEIKILLSLRAEALQKRRGPAPGAASRRTTGAAGRKRTAPEPARGNG
jgi:DNA-binding response OmpR family regulator